MSSTTPVSGQIRNRHTRNALLHLRREMNNLFGDVGVQNILYVAKNGDNATAQPNSIVYKYLTVQAAVTAAAALVGPTLIYVGPGTYVESVVVPDGAANIAIAGDTVFSARIAPPVGSPAIVVAPVVTPVVTFALANLLLFGSVVRGDPDIGLVVFDGSALPGRDLFSGCVLQNVVFSNQSTGPALYCDTVEDLAVDSCEFSNAMVVKDDYSLHLLQTAGNVVFRDCSITRMLVNYDSTNPVPAGAGTHIDLYGCQIGAGVTQLGDAELYVQQGEIDGVGLIPALTTAFTDTAATVGRFQSEGVIFQGNLEMDATYNNAQPPPTFAQSWIRDGSIWGDVLVSDGGGGVNHGPRFNGVALQGAFEAENSTPDIRGCVYAQQNLVCTGTGTIDRDSVRFPATCTFPAVAGDVVSAGGAPIITNDGGGPFPAYVGANYTVLVEPMAGAGSEPTWNVIAKTPTGFTGEGWVAGAGAPVECHIVLQRSPEGA